MNITNDRVTEYVNGFYRPLNSFMAVLREDAEGKRVPIILRDTESLLLNLIRIKKPLRLLEIGTAVGYSACCFALASEKTFITTLEVSEEYQAIALQNIGKAGLSDRIEVVLGDAVASLEKLSAEQSDSKKDGYDMVFIDASKSHYKEFWDGCIDLCNDGAVILSDNVLLKARTASDEFVTDKRHKTNVKRMREYLAYITDLDYAQTAVLPVGDGVAISILRGRK